MAASDSAGDDSLYPIAVLIDELKNEDVQVGKICLFSKIQLEIYYKKNWCFEHTSLVTYNLTSTVVIFSKINLIR